MSTADQEDSVEMGDTDQNRSNSVSKKVENLMTLVNTLHKHLEDCAIQWQSNISQEQWKILNQNVITRQSWNKSILSRTYFENPQLDEAFDRILQCEKMFIKYIHNFLAMLQGKFSELTIYEIKNIDNSANCSLPDHSKISHQVESNITMTANSCGDNAQIPEKQIRLEVNENLKESFNTLMEAKLNFDTKFLSFGSEFHGDMRSLLKASKCLCNICTNIMETSRKNEPIQRAMTSRRRTTKRSNRRKKRSYHKSVRIQSQGDLPVPVEMGDNVLQA